MLHYASRVGFSELLQIVLKRSKFDIDAVEGFETPLMTASMLGFPRVVQLLLDNGADVNIRSLFQTTALHAAVIDGYSRVVELLISHGADANALGEYDLTPLHVAAKSSTNVDEIVTLLLKGRADLRADPMGYGVLARAAQYGNFDMVSALLKAGVQPDADEGNALQLALESNNLHCASLLISAGADILFHGGCYGSPISAAVHGGLTALRFLVNEHNIDPNNHDQEGRTPLHVAASGKDKGTIEYLLALGVDVACKDTKGWSALHYAASADTPNSLRILLENTPNQSHMNTDGWSPLHLACRRNGTEFLDLLIQAGLTPTSVYTSHSRRQWNLYDIAYAYHNAKLIDDDGTPKHHLLRECMHNAVRDSLPSRFPETSHWFCNGCCSGVVGISVMQCLMVY